MHLTEIVPTALPTLLSPFLLPGATPSRASSAGIARAGLLIALQLLRSLVANSLGYFLHIIAASPLALPSPQFKSRESFTIEIAIIAFIELIKWIVTDDNGGAIWQLALQGVRSHTTGILLASHIWIYSLASPEKRPNATNILHAHNEYRMSHRHTGGISTTSPTTFDPLECRTSRPLIHASTGVTPTT